MKPINIYSLLKEKIDTRGKQNTRILRPASFSWRDAPINVYRDVYGYIKTDFDVSKYQITGAGKTYYVDFVNGNDTNDGLTLATALKNVQAALDKSDVDIVLVAEGIYKRWNGLPGTPLQPKRNCSIKAIPGHKVTFSMHENLTWALEAGQTKTYKAARTGVFAVVDAKFPDRLGDHFSLTKRNSIAEVEANAGSYYWDGTNVYVRTSDDRVPDNDNLRVLLTTRVMSSDLGVDLYLEGIDFEGGDEVVRFFNTAGILNSNIYAKNCTFKYSATSDVLVIGTGGNAFFQDCLCAYGGADGFNYLVKNGVTPKVIEVNCIGRNNGKNTGVDSDNGSTMHDGGKVIRVNGLYYGNYGSNVGDIGVGTESWNIGCVAHSSKAATVNNMKTNFNAHQDSKMWNDSCVSYGSLNALTVQTNAFMYLRNCEFSGLEALEGTGQVVNY